MAGGLVDKEHAIKFVAEYFRVEDIHQMILSIEREKSEQMQAAQQEILQSMQSPGKPSGGMPW